MRNLTLNDPKRANVVVKESFLLKIQTHSTPANLFLLQFKIYDAFDYAPTS